MQGYILYICGPPDVFTAVCESDSSFLENVTTRSCLSLMPGCEKRLQSEDVLSFTYLGEGYGAAGLHPFSREPVTSSHSSVEEMVIFLPFCQANVQLR